MRVFAVAAFVCLLAQGTVAARGRREHHTDPKAYLKRANRLAGEGKCAEAVKDFTKAYEKLKDPVVLFNRAECYRRMGEGAKAVEDYRGFLKGFPAAPNRADIEAKIAALEKPPAPPPASRPPPPGKAPPVPPTTATAPPQPGRTPPPLPGRTPPATTATPPAPPAPPVAKVVPPKDDMAGMEGLLPPPPPPGTPAGELIEAPRTPPAEKPKAEERSSHWWLWTALAVVAVGGGVAGFIYFRPKEEPIPETPLGNYRF